MFMKVEVSSKIKYWIVGKNIFAWKQFVFERLLYDMTVNQKRKVKSLFMNYIKF